ncbi:MAG TPA: hypothetical protein VLV16_14730 [Gemmatimonadales bacterium]|nr:hypothetical protein [Gemmatimonadales bacterium]
MRAQTRAVKPLRFDATAIPATRDSFLFFVDRTQRGYAVWQYEVRKADKGEQVVYTQFSELQPLEQEEQRVVIDRATGRPVSFFYHLEMFSPASDTILVEVDVTLKQGVVDGRRSASLKAGGNQTVPVHRELPEDAVFGSYELLAAAVTNANPGETLAVPAYRETHDSLVTLTMTAGQPTSVRVPAGRFDVLPLSSGDFRVYVTRVAPRRVVKGETSDGRFTFELARSGPAIPSTP